MKGFALKALGGAACFGWIGLFHTKLTDQKVSWQTMLPWLATGVVTGAVIGVATGIPQLQQAMTRVVDKSVPRDSARLSAWLKVGGPTVAGGLGGATFGVLTQPDGHINHNAVERVALMGALAGAGAGAFWAMGPRQLFQHLSHSSLGDTFREGSYSLKISSVGKAFYNYYQFLKKYKLRGQLVDAFITTFLADVVSQLLFPGQAESWAHVDYMRSFALAGVASMMAFPKNLIYNPHIRTPVQTHWRHACKYGTARSRVGWEIGHFAVDQTWYALKAYGEIAMRDYRNHVSWAQHWHHSVCSDLVQMRLLGLGFFPLQRIAVKHLPVHLADSTMRLLTKTYSICEHGLFMGNDHSDKAVPGAASPERLITALQALKVKHRQEEASQLAAATRAVLPPAPQGIVAKLAY